MRLLPEETQDAIYDEIYDALGKLDVAYKGSCDMERLGGNGLWRGRGGGGGLEVAWKMRENFHFFRLYYTPYKN